MSRDKNIERLEGKIATISGGAQKIGATIVCGLFMAVQRLLRWW